MSTGSQATRSAGSILCKYPRLPPSPPQPSPASTILQEGGPCPGDCQDDGCCYEAFVSPHADFTGPASGWFQLSGTQDSAGVCLPGCSIPSAPGKGREQGCGGRAKATSSGIPQPSGSAPVGPARRTEPGLSGEISLSTAAAAAPDMLITICFSTSLLAWEALGRRRSGGAGGSSG